MNVGSAIMAIVMFNLLLVAISNHEPEKEISSKGQIEIMEAIKKGASPEYIEFLRKIHEREGK